MVELLNVHLGETQDQILICPIYEDFILETSTTRHLKKILSHSLDFFAHRREIKNRLKGELNGIYKCSFQDNLYPFRSIYYWCVRDFFGKLNFGDLSRTVSQIFLEILDHEGKASVALSVLGLDYFNVSTELEILANGLERAYTDNSGISSLSISICLGNFFQERSVNKSLFSKIFVPNSSFRGGNYRRRGSKS